MSYESPRCGSSNEYTQHTFMVQENERHCEAQLVCINKKKMDCVVNGHSLNAMEFSLYE